MQRTFNKKSSGFRLFEKLMIDKDENFIFNKITVNVNYPCKKHKHMYQSKKKLYLYIWRF